MFQKFIAGETGRTSGSSSVRSVLLEGLLVAMAGVALAFVANALSPRGLNLGRDYFPNDRRSATIAPVNSTNTLSETNALSPAERLVARFRTEGLQLADSDHVVKLFRDSRYSQGLVVFVDARKDHDYQAGHIPGAYQLDHFHPEDYIATTLPVCQTAEEIIVYCNGGECDDSENTAIFLRDAGIPKERLFVYSGGMEDWTTRHMPIESAARNSGSIRNNK